MSLIKTLENAWNAAVRKQWNKIYIAIDIHDTIVYSNYKVDELPTEFTPGAKETLQYLSTRQDIVLILYTCSWPKEIEKYLEYFKLNFIKFDYINKNPEVPNNALGHYDDKLYFNILLDDKACFDFRNDWYIIKNWIASKPILK